MATIEYVRQLLASLNDASGDTSLRQRLEDELRQIVIDRQLNLAPLQGEFIKLIHNRLSNNVTNAEINRWSLFHSLLRNFFFTNIGLEQALTALRRQIFVSASEDASRASSLRELILSIAIQNHKNEYAHFVQQDEAELLRSLLTRLSISSSDGITAEPPIQLSLALMYLSPVELDADNRLDVRKLAEHDAQVAKYLEEVLGFHQREIEIAEHYLAESNLSDDTSVKVAEMYRENPYPRWTESLASMNPNKLPLEILTGVGSFTHYIDSDHAVNDVLVAGCGTGRHPIQLALNYPWLNITAIDISYRSISYARIMAENAGVENIEFKICDILDAASLDKQFDMIDSIGVLHHMEDPEKGLQALLPLLNDNGLFRLGLYSKAARTAIRHFRDTYSDDRSSSSADQLRQIRQEIIRNHQDEHNSQVILSHDFYTLSGCRDLLLHQQEIQYTVPMIRQLLDNNNLAFLGIGLPHPDLVAAIHRTCGATADIHDLDNWEKAEAANPYLFARMYNFFTQKQG